jgi:hypothetical protein
MRRFSVRSGEETRQAQMVGVGLAWVGVDARDVAGRADRCVDPALSRVRAERAGLRAEFSLVEPAGDWSVADVLSRVWF